MRIQSNVFARPSAERLPGIGLLALTCFSWPISDAVAQDRFLYRDPYYRDPYFYAPPPPPRLENRRPDPRRLPPRSESPRRQAGKPRETVKLAPPPPGPHMLIVSVRSQNVSFYAGGKLVSQSPVSTGKDTHPTPFGVFSVIQRSRHHRSNIYSGAPMPYMQRLTWSGIALHEGALPGYPASHGCIRLPESYASYLWQHVRMNTRVIVSREDVAPFEIAHPLLFQPRPDPATAEAPPDLRKTLDTTSARLRTASAGTIATDGAGEPAGEGSNSAPQGSEVSAAADLSVPATETAPDATASIYPRPAEIPAPILASFVQSLDAKQKKAPPKGPISIFISKKEKRLYVRQHFVPLFSAEVSFKDASENFGTHVFSAIAQDGNEKELRWTAVTMPQELPQTERIKTRKVLDRHGRQIEVPVKPAAKVPEPKPIPSLSAAAALDRIEIAPEVVERISEYVTAGASLIVSDHGLGTETANFTDFIVVTR